jgi:hypothetical protein
MEVRPLMGEQTEKSEAGPYAKGTKEYMLLLYEAEARWATMSQADIGETMGRYVALKADMVAKGQYVAGARLDSVKKAKVVGAPAGSRVVKDGPFAETREQLGGYYRVAARDLDEAIALAARIPAAETGIIEIRPIRDTSAYA